MKNIVCFIESLAGGGAEHQMVHLATKLHQKGYNVEYVVYGDMPDHYTLPSDIRIVRLGQGKYRLCKLWDVFCYFIRKKTDCVISFRQACNFLVLIPLFFRSRKIKVIVGERNLTIGPSDFYERCLFNILYHRADHIISNSYSQAKYLESRKKNWAKRVGVIINFTEFGDSSIVKQSLSEDVIRIGIFSRFNPQKNCIRFAEMLSLVKAKTNRKFEIVWHGNIIAIDGELSTNYLQFESKIEELGLKDVITIKTAVKNVFSEFGKFHALALPSLYEGFSNSIAEGICSGMPMLVSDVSDNSIMVRDEQNGYLFDPYDVESMANAFVKFINLSKKEREAMSQTSKKIANELFNNDDFINGYVALIEKNGE